MDISQTLTVDDTLHAFVEQELLPGSGVETAAFWTALETVLADFTPKNAALLARRDELQAKIDGWWLERSGKPFDVAEETAFLREIGYLLPEPAPFARRHRQRRSPRSPPWPGRSWWCRSPTPATP